MDLWRLRQKVVDAGIFETTPGNSFIREGEMEDLIVDLFLRVADLEEHVRNLEYRMLLSEK